MNSIPAPLDMTHKEAFDWIAENVTCLTWDNGVWKVNGVASSGKLMDAICQAAAMEVYEE